MLIQFWMTQMLTREVHELEKQAMDLRTQLSHYQKYAGMLGGTSIITFNNIAGLSTELLPRASVFAQFSDQASSMSAMQQMQTMKMSGRVPMTGDAVTQQQMEMSAFAQFKEQALKALKQQETNVLNEKEQEIQLELNSVEQRLKAKQAMLDGCKQEALKQAEEKYRLFS